MQSSAVKPGNYRGLFLCCQIRAPYMTQVKKSRKVIKWCGCCIC